MKLKNDFRLILSIGLTCAGLFVSLAAFAIFYKHLIVLPYPKIRDVPKQEATITIVGDVMLAGNVARSAQKSENTFWMWEHIGDFLLTSDFVVGNLESPTNGTNVYSYQKTLVLNALPELIRTLSQVNFSLLSLANNHTLDQGQKGLVTTQKLLTEIGVKSVGSGEDIEEAWKPKILTKGDIKIAFFGASYAAYNDDGTKQYPGIARIQDMDILQKSIQEIRGSVDCIIVLMHAGAEYTRKITPLQEAFAKKAIDVGANIVVGSHPHWTQKTESYHGGHIFYSLGNFVFDQDFSQETKTGLALRIRIQKRDTREGWKTDILPVELHPIYIENSGQPRLLIGEEKSKALRDINLFSNTVSF